jgi:hypothetical protein
MESEGSLPRSQELSTCTYPEPDQSSPHHPTSTRFILMLSNHRRLGLPSGFLPSGFPTNNLYTSFFSSIHATCPAHLIRFNLIILIILREEYNSCGSSLRFRKDYENEKRQIPSNGSRAVKSRSDRGSGARTTFARWCTVIAGSNPTGAMEISAVFPRQRLCDGLIHQTSRITNCP